MNDFDFYASGIEDTILELLKQVLKPLGVKTFDTYAGELDKDNVEKFIREKTPSFPIVLVGYGSGDDKKSPVTSPVLGEAMHFQHDCHFIVTVVTNDSRGDKKQRRGKLGCYRLISIVRETLAGLQVKKVITQDDIDLYGDQLYGSQLSLGAEILLTHKPLTPIFNDYIARLPDITAYAVAFDTYFKWSSKDRRQDGTAVVSVTVGVDSLNDSTNAPANKPGVNFSTGEQ